MQTGEQLAFSVSECALSANCGRDKIYEAIRDGRLKARKFGRKTLVLREDLTKFLQSLPLLNLNTDTCGPTKPLPSRASAVRASD